MVESGSFYSYERWPGFQMPSLRKKGRLSTFKGMMVIYYCITIVTNIVAAIVFHKSINVTGLSIIPLFLIAWMIFQAFIFKNEKVENGFRTAYGSSLTDDEENKMLGSDRLSFLPQFLGWYRLFFSFRHLLNLFLSWFTLSDWLAAYCWYIRHENTKFVLNLEKYFFASQLRRKLR